jgi:hypothetical protein
MKLKTISRDEQLERLRRRYKSRGSEGKSRMLDELDEPITVCQFKGCTATIGGVTAGLEGDLPGILKVCPANLFPFAKLNEVGNVAGVWPAVFDLGNPSYFGRYSRFRDCHRELDCFHGLSQP